MRLQLAKYLNLLQVILRRVWSMLKGARSWRIYPDPANAFAILHAALLSRRRPVWTGMESDRQRTSHEESQSTTDSCTFLNEPGTGLCFRVSRRQILRTLENRQSRDVWPRGRVTARQPRLLLRLSVETAYSNSQLSPGTYPCALRLADAHSVFHHVTLTSVAHRCFVSPDWSQRLGRG